MDEDTRKPLSGKDSRQPAQAGQRLRAEWPEGHPVQDFEGLLTLRETEVLQQIVNGASNAQIASSLQISVETVKSHIKNILQKLQARDRTQAVVTALQAQLVNFPD